MEELIKQITSKVNISPEQAKQAVDQVLVFLKQRLPAPIAGQVENVLKGINPQDVAGTLGGLFGKK